MTTYGLTEDGFVAKPFSAIHDEIKAALRDAFGASLRLDARSVFGQLAAIFAEREFLLWQLAEVVNNAWDPDVATGAALEQISVLSGTFRPQASSSTTVIVMTGDDGTSVPEGTVFSTTSTDKRFTLLEDSSLALADVHADTTDYEVNDIVSNDDAGSDHIYICVTAGTSGTSSGAPSATDRDHTEFDGTVEWSWLGAGLAFAPGTAIAEETGPIHAGQFDLENIETPVGGLENVVNLAEAELGRDVASDEELRILRERELAVGAASVDAIISAIHRISDDVLAVHVFVNDEDEEDDDGLPPHSIEVLVRGGDDQDIADTLFLNVAAGIKTFGTETGTVVDVVGVEHEVKFSRHTAVPIYVAVTLTYDADLYPTDGDDAVAEAIVDFGDDQENGKNVVASALVAQCFEVPGVLDASAFIGLSIAPGVSTTIQISLRELATFDATRITVASTPGTP